MWKEVCILLQGESREKAIDPNRAIRSYGNERAAYLLLGNHRMSSVIKGNGVFRLIAMQLVDCSVIRGGKVQILFARVIIFTIL